MNTAFYEDFKKLMIIPHIREKLYSYFDHPQKVCMTYLEHCSFSLSLSCYFMEASLKALIHSFFPNMFITSSSDHVTKIKELLENSGCRKEEFNL